MSNVEKAFETQLKNIQTRTGKTLEELYAILRQSGLNKHGELRELLKRELGMGHGDANSVVHFYFKSLESQAPGSEAGPSVDVLDQIYTGTKAQLRPIHERLLAAITLMGEFEIAPKKGYVSLRRKKQFAMIGPGTRGRVEVGLNIKGLQPGERLQEMPPGGMCQYKVFLTGVDEVDDELIAWIKLAFEASA